MGSKYFGNKHENKTSSKKTKGTPTKKGRGKKVGAGIRKVGRGK